MSRLKTQTKNYSKLLAVVAAVVVAGLGLSHLALAATGSLTFSPSSGTYNKDSTFTVTVQENSGTDAANTIDAFVKYPASLLEFVSDTTVAPFGFNPAGTDTPSGGVVEITRSQLGTSSTSAQTVSVITFKVLNPGSATISFNPGSKIFAASDGSNLLTSSPSVTYTLQLPPPAAPVITSFVATPGSVVSGGTSVLSWQSTGVVAGGCSIGSTSLTAGDGAGSWTTPALTSSVSYTLTCKNSANVPTTKSATVTVTQPTPSGPGQSGNPKAGSVKVNNVTVPNNGNVSVNTPVDVQPATIQTEGVSKVEYYLNGKLVDTETKAPFTYKVDTTKLGNGSYSLVSKTYYANGSTKSATQHLVVKNTAKKVSNSSIGLSLVLFAGIIVGLIMIQRRRGQMHPNAYAPVDVDRIVTSEAPSTKVQPPTVTPPTPPVTPLPRTTINVNTPEPGSVIQHNPDDKPSA